MAIQKPFLDPVMRSLLEELTSWDKFSVVVMGINPQCLQNLFARLSDHSTRCPRSKIG